MRRCVPAVRAARGCPAGARAPMAGTPAPARAVPRVLPRQLSRRAHAPRAQVARNSSRPSSRARRRGAAARSRRDRAALRRARRGAAGGAARGGCAAPATVRGRGLLRRQPQHQLHQHLPLSLRLLRLLQGAQRARACAAPAYRLDLGEIARRTREAWAAGATEVCLQGGIHPSFTGQTYLEIVAAVKARRPGRCTCTPSRRWRSPTARAPSGCPCSATSANCAPRASPRCRAPRRRSWMMRCARSSARTS